MSATRRTFVKALAAGAATISVRRDALAALRQPAAAAEPAQPIPLHNNENPLGPGDGVLDAIRSALGQGAPAGRYPSDGIDRLHAAIAAHVGVAPQNVLAGCGSTELLRTTVQLFTSPAKALVAAAPTYEGCTNYAELIGTPLRAVPVGAGLRLDLDAMAEAARGAGLVYVNNPNNPTATIVPARALDACIARVLAQSPETTVLVDEAYHDYVTDPAHRSQVAAAARNPRLIVVRTFSKAHGMAGLRVGYAVGHPDTIRRLAAWDGVNSLNAAAIAAALASLADRARLERERARNTEARAYAQDWLSRAGFTASDSQANFVFVELRRPAREFREACREKGVLVGRDFPPFEKTHARISIGTLDEMKQATTVFAKVLGT